MGVVYDAVQDQPHRSIALKVIRAELATPEMRRRFARESEVLGRLQHAGIAQIYEAGSADGPNGAQTYFAMELVRGVALTTYASESCRDHGERLELFAQVCDAVHYAHQRGVIHRDLKPANILVDADGRAKVLDFGVARLTDADTQATTATAAGEIVGTLQYMSPEQVNGDPLEVDTRSDIYSLGLILFELLTGRRPYDLTSKPILEAIRIILADDPPAASFTDRRLRGDLDTIVAKAMEKDKERRYASAAALASDIRRHLRYEPIAARPASAVYQIGKFARRHRGLVGGLLATAIVLVTGTIVSTMFAYRARAAELSAEKRREEAQGARVLADQRRIDAETQRAAADTARADAIRERGVAFSNAAQARKEAAKARAVNGFLTDMLASADPDVAQGRTLSVKDVADQAVVKLREGHLSAEPEVRADVYLTLGTTYFAATVYDTALRYVDSARVLRVRSTGARSAGVVESQLLAAKILQGKRDLPEAERRFQEVLAASRRLNPPRPELSVEALLGLAIIAQFAQREIQAESLAIEALSLARRSYRAPNEVIAGALRAVAEVMDFNGKPKLGAPYWHEALEMFRGLHGERHTTTLTAGYGLGYNAYRQGNYAAAESLLRPVHAGMRTVYGSSNATTISALNWLATTISAQGRRDEAQPMMREVLSARLQVLGEDHLDVQLVRSALGRSLYQGGKFAEAETLFLAALAARTRTLGPRHGGVASSLLDLAELAEARGDLVEAERRYRASLAIWREGRIERMEVSTARNLAWVLARTGNLEEADRLFRDAVARQRTLTGVYSADVALSTSYQGFVALRRGNLAEADSLYGLTVEIRRRVYGDRAINVATPLTALGEVRAQRGDSAAAVRFLREALDITRASRPAGDVALRYRMARLGELQCAMGQLVEGEQLSRAALAAAPAPGLDTAAVHTRAALGRCLLQSRRFADAEAVLLEAEVSARGGPEPLRRMTVARLISLYEQWGKRDAAEQWRGRM